MRRTEGSPPVVAHLVSELRPGGVEVRTLELLKLLSWRAEKHIVCTMSGRKGPLAGEYEAISVPVVPLVLRSVSFPFRFIMIMRRERVTVVHSNIHYTSGYLLALAFISGVPIRICHFRSDGPKRIGLLHTIRASLMKRLIGWFATSIVGVSPGALEHSWSARWASDPRCRVVQNGINLGSYLDLEPAVLEKIGIGGDAYPILAHVGRADLPTKNRDKAIRVLAALHKFHPNAVVLFVGRDGQNDSQAGENRERWNQIACELEVQKHVFFAGERGDVNRLLCASDGFLLTSTLEGLPGVLLEALAVGLPAVSTALPGAQYISDEVGGVTLIDEHANDSEWADAIVEAVRSAEPTGSDSEGISRGRLKGSAFDLAVSSQQFVDVWNL